MTSLTFFGELFACQKEPRSLPLTLENLSDDEKRIFKLYFPRLLLHFMSDPNMMYILYKRESLSGFTIFRIEILPAFQMLFDDLKVPMCRFLGADQDGVSEGRSSFKIGSRARGLVFFPCHSRNGLRKNPAPLVPDRTVIGVARRLSPTVEYEAWRVLESSLCSSPPNSKFHLYESHIRELALMCRINDWEKYLKRFIIKDYSQGYFEDAFTSHFIYMSSVTDEVKRAHPWWNKDYKEDDDQINSLKDEYDLND
uniref:Uncharacterized protein n=1 Tax=Pristionchus pacificus TaxID=54126 RepID=A0A8R1UP09_PRIPA